MLNDLLAMLCFLPMGFLFGYFARRGGNLTRKDETT